MKGLVGGKGSFNSGDYEGKSVAALLVARFDYRQHRLDKTAAGGALRPKRQLPPYHRMTQRMLFTPVEKCGRQGLKTCRPKP